MELAKNKKAREETEDRCADELAAMIEKLEKEVEQERKTSDESSQRLLTSLHNQIDRCGE